MKENRRKSRFYLDHLDKYVFLLHGERKKTLKKSKRWAAGRFESSGRDGPSLKRHQIHATVFTGAGTRWPASPFLSTYISDGRFFFLLTCRSLAGNSSTVVFCIFIHNTEMIKLLTFVFYPKWRKLPGIKRSSIELSLHSLRLSTFNTVDFFSSAFNKDEHVSPFPEKTGKNASGKRRLKSQHHFWHGAV